MFTFLISLILSGIINLLLIRYPFNGNQNLLDHDLESVQKFHVTPVPRIGGIGILLGCVLGLCLKRWLVDDIANLGLELVEVALPTFFIGLIEDVTKRISVIKRLTITALSALLATFLLDARLTHLDLLLIDPWLMMYPVSVFITCFAVAGVANAFNIIDGFNGLSSGVAVIILFGLLYVAHQVGDAPISLIAMAMIGGILGFMMWNYPRGLIFLGDGGAYFVGFIIAEISVLLVQRHHEISPWFPLLLIFYPIVETCFTIFRRAFIKGVSVGLPDASHLHQLIYRRIIKTKHTNKDTLLNQVYRNSATAPYLWLMCLFSVVPAILFFNQTIVLQIAALIYIILYIYMYRGMYQRQIPRWLMIHITKRH